MANLILLPLKSIADLFGIDSIPALLYKNIEKDASDKLQLSERTFRDVLNGKKKPSKKTLNKLSTILPFCNLDQFKSLESSIYMTDWELIIQLPAYTEFPYFPYFKNKFASLAMDEASLIRETSSLSSETERIQYLFNHPFIHFCLNIDEISVITNGDDFGIEKKIILTKLSLKMLLYCIAYIDAEYGISRKEDRGDRFSFIKKILPKFEQDDYINPVDLFFKLLKDHYKTTYTDMAKSLSVDTKNPDEEEQLNAKRRKFRTWRNIGNNQKLKQASYNEIKSILYALAPELEKLELFHSTLLYYYAYFLHNIFEESLKGKIDDATIFDSKHELVDWIKTNYDDYFEKAYVEIEILIAKDTQRSTFS